MQAPSFCKTTASDGPLRPLPPLRGNRVDYPVNFCGLFNLGAAEAAYLTTPSPSPSPPPFFRADGSLVEGAGASFRSCCPPLHPDAPLLPPPPALPGTDFRTWHIGFQRTTTASRPGVTPHPAQTTGSPSISIDLNTQIFAREPLDLCQTPTLTKMSGLYPRLGAGIAPIPRIFRTTPSHD